MEIFHCQGVQLEKSSPTSPEDGFIRSEVQFQVNEEKRIFQLIYLEFFEKKLEEFTPFQEDPIMSIGEGQIFFKDIVALAALLNNGEFMQQKRVYIHDYDDFKNLYQNMEWENVKQVMIKIANQ